jgi:hypothetical protein
LLFEMVFALQMSRRCRNKNDYEKQERKHSQI